MPAEQEYSNAVTSIRMANDHAAAAIIQSLVEEAMEKREEEVRDDCGTIAALEGEYWKNVKSAGLDLATVCAMGASANICASILMGNTPEKHTADISRRDKART